MASLPSVPGFPIIGSGMAFLKSPIEFFDINFHRLGDTFRFELLTRKIVATRDLKWIEHALVKQQKKYNKDFSMKQIGLALGKGLLTNSGESWMRQRRLASPAFYKKRLEGMVDIMETITDEHIQKIKALPSGSRFRIDEEMITMTASIALQTLLGEKMTDELRKVQSSMVDIQEHLVKRIRVPFFTSTSHIDGSHRNFMAKIKIIDDIIYDIIDKKRKNESYGNDLVTMLMEARDEDTGEGMPDKQLRDELLTIYVAGHETSAYCLSWTFYELMRHPDIYQKIKEEAAAVVKDGKIGADGLKGLTYTRAVVNESMRLFPPAYLVSRECGEDDEIDGVKINKGDVILMSIYGLHRNPKHWPQPLSFRPERFLETTEATKHYHIPFGAGPRMCIGNHFAMMEITLILAKVALNLDLEWVIGQKIEMQPLVTLKPKHGILLEKV